MSNLILVLKNEEMLELYGVQEFGQYHYNVCDDSGFDLILPNDVYLHSTIIKINLQIKAFLVDDMESFIPLPFYLMARSSIYKSSLSLCNGVGLIDANYRGDIKIAVYNMARGEDDNKLDKGSSIVQLTATDANPIKYIHIISENSDEYKQLMEKCEDRGGGFGSTGISGNSKKLVKYTPTSSNVKTKLTDDLALCFILFIVSCLILSAFIRRH